jgi:phosphatidylserine decarboxylase
MSALQPSKPRPLPIWDRQRGFLFEEFMADHPNTYDTYPRWSLTQLMESHPLYDWLMAAYQNSGRSARQIKPFIERHNIDISEFKPVAYHSFAEFFDREFLPGARRFPDAPNEMGAFAEARYFAWDKLTADQHFPVKGHSLAAETILGTTERARSFAGGPVILARLSPVDYHHVHYSDSGSTLEYAQLGYRLWTVNWRALQAMDDILFRNERQINIIQTDNFGRLGFVEVGAMSVGRIVQVHPLDRRFERGAEKAVFKFGGSAIVVFGEPGAWRPAADIVERTGQGVESLVRLGETIASSARA